MLHLVGARGAAAVYIRIAAGSVISAVASVLISKPDILARACQAMAARVDRTTSASGTLETSRNVTAVILRLHSVRRTGKIDNYDCRSIGNRRECRFPAHRQI